MKTFLKNLEKELINHSFDEETITEIINDHEEMIQSALDEGLDETKITEKFGDPEKIAKELKELEPSDNNTSDDYELIKSFDSKTINNIDVKLISEDLILELTDNNQVEVHGKRVKIRKYDIGVDSDCLTIQRKNEKTLGIFSFTTSSSGIFIIKIPREKKLKEINYKATSGDFVFANINLEAINIKNVSGDIEGKIIDSTNFYIKTVSGDVELNKCNMKDLTISIVSGDIDINTTIIKESLKINSISGDTKIEDCESNELLYNSVSGDFKAKEYYPKNASFKSVTGDIEFKNKDKDKKINIISKKSLKGEIKV